MCAPKKPVFPVSGACMGFSDQTGFKKGLKKLFQLVPDACLGDVREGLYQQGKSLVARKGSSKQLPDHGPGTVETEDVITVAVGKKNALSCLPAIQARPLLPLCPAVSRIAGYFGCGKPTG